MSTIEKRIHFPLFLASLSILLFEMTQIRIFAYSLTPILAYTAISLSMTGFGVGAMVLSLVPGFGQKNLVRTLGLLAIAQAVTMIGAESLLALVSWKLIQDFQSNIIALIFEILIPSIVPHFFMGLFVAIIFKTVSENIGRIYFWNLLGSGLGCVALVLLLRTMGAEKLVAVSAFLSACSALLVGMGRRERVVTIGGGLAVLLSALCFVFAERLMPFEPDPIDTMGFSIRTAEAKGQKPPTYDFGEWNVVGKVEVWNNPAEHVYLPEEHEVRVLSVDSGGTTQLVSAGDTPGWGKDLFEQSIYGIAYGAKPNPDEVLVIGCGGGLDVQAALHHGAKRVTAVEINSSTINAITGPYAEFLGWPNLPNTEVVHDDGRSYVKATSKRFDSIQMTGVDTITVYATGSINMNEDSLYTVDAFIDYLQALKPDGIYTVLRVGNDYIRLSAIATQALLALGVKDPAHHVVAVRHGGASGVLVKRKPFTKDELDNLERYTSRKERSKISIPHFDLYQYRIADPMELLYVPGRIEPKNFLAYFGLVRTQPAMLPAFYEKTNVAVPTDDNPYYMLGQLLTAKKHMSKFQETFDVLKTFWVTVVLIAVVLIMLPVLVVRRNVEGMRPMTWVIPYFFLIGVCFMLLEISIIHIFAVFVGSPGASLAVVLTSILIFTGIGAYVSEKFARDLRRTIIIATVVLTVCALVFLATANNIFDFFWGLGIGQWGRAIVTSLLLAPIGLAMGAYFPSGLRAIGLNFQRDQFIPWAVSINGFASVLGSVVVLPFSMYYGFRSMYVTAVVGYVLVAVLSHFYLKGKQTAV